MVHNLSIQIQKAKPTAFHRMLQNLAKEGRLLRLFSQNIDDLDISLPSLATKTPLAPPYPTTLQLHGSAGKMTCTSCHRIADLDPELFKGPFLSPCEACSNLKNSRMRGTKIGGMRPRFTLYDEHGADDAAIGEAIELDLKERYDIFIVAGTALKGIPSVQELVHDIRSRVKLMVWINRDPPPEMKGVTWDLTFQGLCDDVAREFLGEHVQTSVQDTDIA